VIQSNNKDDSMTRITLSVLGVIALAFQLQAADGEWQSLFDGKSLDNWEARAKGDVKAVGGEIHILTKANLWLVHKEEFENFELEVEALMPADGYNSGIGFRCTGDKKPLGYQCEVANKKSGSIYAIGKGWVLPKDKNEWNAFYKVAGDCFKVNEWNKFRIRCEGNRIQMWINGHQTADVKDDKYNKGSVALQHHGKGDVHRFRNVRIKKLP
jgi:hypothetical protein